MTAPDPRTLLFLSCDLVGSTHFKQSRKLWQKVFLSFYREFPQILGELTHAQPASPHFELWKPIGDELIFTVRVGSESEIFQAVRIWIEAMSLYETTVLGDIGMKTKGGSFTATFPGPDSESSIPRDPGQEKSDKGVVELNDEALQSRSVSYMFDYFGPSIDTGFRVISASSNRYFTLSVEVAWALAQCAVDAGVNLERYPLADLRMLEPREFKGVWDGRAYPLFALDLHSTDPVNVAFSKIQATSLQALDVVNLCRACSDTSEWPSRLYLPKSKHGEFQAVPVDTLDELRTNSMDGAETVPDGGEAGESLETDAPLGNELQLNED